MVGTDLRSYINELNRNQVTAYNKPEQPKKTRLPTVFHHAVLILIIISIMTRLFLNRAGTLF